MVEILYLILLPVLAVAQVDHINQLHLYQYILATMVDQEVVVLVDFQVSILQAEMEMSLQYLQYKDMVVEVECILEHM